MQGKTVIVTGGANGIGRCIAETFVKAGAHVAVIDTDGARGQTLEKACGGKLWFYEGDIGRQGVLDAFVERVKAQYPAVDVLINNACLTRKELLTGCDYASFSYVLAVGVTAPYYLSMRLQDWFAPGASILNLCSTRAEMSQADTESYSAAKGAVFSLTHALGASLAGRVRVNSISPGWIDTARYHEGEEVFTPSPGDTAQHPAGRIGQPEDIAAMALFLASEGAGFITGENIRVDGGMTRLMIYHDDHGWTYRPREEQSDSV